ncbi:MAG: protein arginine kinase [Clostridiales bacterium]|nr:protein arginine kinase [Clostridiales bacterium]
MKIGGETVPSDAYEIKKEADIVVSSRVRLARNFENLSFPLLNKNTNEDEIIEKIYLAIAEGDESRKDEFALITIANIDKIDRLNYVEKHLISIMLSKNIRTGAFVLSKDETISIMINEEDHVRIQCILPDLQLEKALEETYKIDDLIEKRMTYDFDEKFGYLSSCPTNIGTGLRASVMLHLPVLNNIGYITGIRRVAGQIGLAVRGIYGEGTEAKGNLFQISNQITLGISEEETLKNLKNTVVQIIQKESTLREKLLLEKKDDIEDSVFRALGILKNARIITSNEAMKLISNLKLGVALNIIQEISFKKIDQLMAIIQVGYLHKHYKKDLTEKERDIKRAEIIREKVK